MTNLGKYDVMKTENGKTTLYKVCPNRAYACVVARGENTAQYNKGIFIGNPNFVNYFVCLHQ